MTRYLRFLPILVAVVAAMWVVIPNAAALGFTTMSYVPSAQFCDGTNGTPAHNPTQWHPLFLTNADGTLKCTYGHEHGANPDDAQLDSVLGVLSIPGQSISYPWATLSPSNVQENSTDIKHRVYHWITWENGPTARKCDPNDPNWLGVTNGRVQYHIDGNLNAVSRFHSFYAEVTPYNCVTGVTGTLTFGGHLDYPILVTDGNVTYAQRVPLSNDPGPVPGDPNNTTCPIGGNSKNESSATTLSMSVWYGITQTAPNHGCQPTLLANETNDAYGFGPHLAFTNNIDINSFGPIDRNNPSALLFFGNNREQHDETQVTSDTFEVSLQGFDPYIANNHLDFDGYTDRHANIVSGCTSVSMDCVPVHIHVPTPPNWALHQPVNMHADIFAGDGGAVAVYDGEKILPPGYARGSLVLDPGASPPPPPTPTPVPPTPTPVPTPTPTPTPTCFVRALVNGVPQDFTRPSSFCTNQ